ncbi:hypothetical protein GVAV_000335 [Gurleya vavrai]
MRIKQKAIQSLKKNELTTLQTNSLIKFNLSKYFMFRNNRKEKENVLNAIEKRFCKDNNIVEKTFIEMKSMYKKKGKAGLRSFTRNRKMNEKKVNNVFEFFKKAYGD